MCVYAFYISTTFIILWSHSHLLCHTLYVIQVLNTGAAAIASALYPSVCTPSPRQANGMFENLHATSIISSTECGSPVAITRGFFLQHISTSFPHLGRKRKRLASPRSWSHLTHGTCWSTTTPAATDIKLFVSYGGGRTPPPAN